MRRAAVVCWGMLVLGGAGGDAARAAEGPSLAPCLKKLRASAKTEADIPPQVFDRFVGEIAYDASLAEAGPPPPEFSNPTWEYAGFLVDERKVEEGRELLDRWQAPLKHIQARTGVDPETVVAFFGVETDYGRFGGHHPVLASLANRACGPISGSEAARKRARGQFYAAIQVLQLGDVAPEEFKGSYAGAFGLTQFIPATYLAHRGGKPGQPLADGDQDGRVDAMHSIPDALMLTALKVQADGWRPGQPWALGVTLREGFDGARVLREKAFGGSLYSRVSAQLLRDNRRTLADWQALGVQLDAADRDTPAGTVYALISLNDDGPGPYVLASSNFEAHYRYNYSINYAYAVGALADRLKGLPPLPLRWAGDDRGLSRDEIAELQGLMSARHAELAVDGRPGTKTRLAIAAEEQRLGRPATGRTGYKLLEALRAEAGAGQAAEPVRPAASEPDAVNADPPPMEVDGNP